MAPDCMQVTPHNRAARRFCSDEAGQNRTCRIHMLNDSARVTRPYCSVWPAWHGFVGLGMTHRCFCSSSLFVFRARACFAATSSAIALFLALSTPFCRVDDLIAPACDLSSSTHSHPMSQCCSVQHFWQGEGKEMGCQRSQ